VKSLSKLKCVSKPLNYIISDPKFAKDHLCLSRTRHYNLLLRLCGLFSEEFNLFESPLPFVLNDSTSTIPWTKLNFPIEPCDNPCIIVDSCDGIICFQTRDYNHVNLVVINPYTGQFKILPPLENLHNRATQTIYTIGYDRFIDKYKVVAVNRDQCRSSFNFCKTQVRVHTLGTNFWRRISDFPSEIIGVPKGYVGKHVSGTINWAIRNQAIICSSWVILSLDLGNESYQEISQPDFGLDDPLHDLSLGVSRDCLCILAHAKDSLDIWVMKYYGNKDSWNKLFTIPFMELCYNGIGFFSLLYISEEDGQVFFDLNYEVYVYNYKNRTLKILEIQGLPSNRFTSNVYVESLTSP